MCAYVPAGRCTRTPSRAQILHSFLRATDATKQAHAAEPPRPRRQAAQPVAARRRERLIPEALGQCPITLVAGGTELVVRRTRGEPAALTPRMVGGAGGTFLTPRRRRSASGGEELVVHRLLRPSPPLDRAGDQRDDPLHAHAAMICAEPQQQRWSWRFFLEKQSQQAKRSLCPS